MSPCTTAALLDVDGVLTQTRRLHRRAWAAVFDPLLRGRGSRRPFSASEYAAFVDGRSRLDGIRTFLAARALALPEGAPTDPPGLGTVHALAAEKNRRYLALLDEEGAWAYPDVAPALAAWRRRGLQLGILSGSRNARAVLKAAGIARAFDGVVDGTDLDERQLRGKPAPDGVRLLLCQLGVSAPEALLCEDAAAGIAAGRAAGIGLLVGVVRREEGSSAARAAALRQQGAHIIVSSLEEIPLTSPHARGAFGGTRPDGGGTDFGSPR